MKFASLRVLLVSCFILMMPRMALAEEVMDALLVDGDQQTDMTFGPTAFARPYTTREAAKWGIDFIASPSRAIDRRLFFGYKISRLSAAAIAGIMENSADIHAKPELVAFVNVPNAGPLALLGGDKAYYGTPYFAPPHSNAAAEIRRQFSVSAEELAPRVVALAALKSAGIAVSGLNDEPLRPRNMVAYVAVTHALPGMEKPDMYFVMGESSWDRTGGERSRTWGLRLSK